MSMTINYYPTGQELRSTNRPIYGAASIPINNTIYVYGGFYNVPPWNKEALWSMSTHALTQIQTDPFASPALIYTTLQHFNKTILALGGHLNEQNITQSVPEYLRYYAFDSDTLKWTPLQKNSSSPLERFWHTSVMSQDSIYLYGGMNMTHGISDFWKYDIQTDHWTLLNSNIKARCGHTSTILKDGKIVHLGGYDCSHTSFLRPSDKPLYTLDTATIFDTKTNSWYEQDLKGSLIPKPRTYHTAVKTKEDRIVICGGQDHTAEPFQNYLEADDMTAILDTRTWNWYIPENSPYQPFPRSHAIANVVNETTMVYGFGINYHTVFDGIYVFDLESNSWLPDTTTQRETMASNNPALVICLSVVGGFVTLALVFGLRFKYKKIGTSLRKRVWSPRAGEPFWAELYRFSFRFLFSLLFVGVGIVLFMQVQSSPIMDQQYYHHEPDYSLAAPDIRFCFDDWKDPVIQCVTDYGEGCDHYMTNITRSVGSNVNYYGGKLTCYLFRARSFKLGETSNRHRFNGTFVRFHYYGTPLSNTSRLHIELYHYRHNPNMPAYNITTSDNGFDRWYSPDESAKFQSMEQMNLKTENTFTTQPSTVYTIRYEFLERRKMISDNLWNYIGLGSELESQYFISSHLDKIESRTRHSDPAGIVHVVPARYTTSISSEQRVFTFMNCMGIIGGIFGLVAGFQAMLFGYRPQSPWGALHRWSNSRMQKSLLNGLKTKLPLQDVCVPIVHPVHDPTQDTSQGESEAKRMTLLEDRLYLFELLFQAYYIDDEVFRSLHCKQ